MGGEYHGLFHVSSAPPRPTRPHGPHHAEVAGAPLRMCRIRTVILYEEILYEVGAPLVYLGKITTHSPIVVHASEQRNYY
jgi:hypothetical protein